jgi:His Kinase A (phospho-acceptor) domain
MQPPYRTPVGEMTPGRCCGRTPNASLADCRKRCRGPVFAPILTGAEHPTFESINRLAREYELREYFDGAWALRPAELVSFGMQNFDPLKGVSHADRLATMRRLAASVAHEINQPIGAARNNAHAALRSCPGGARSSGGQGGARLRNQRDLWSRRHPRWDPRADQESATPPGVLRSERGHRRSD